MTKHIGPWYKIRSHISFILPGTLILHTTFTFKTHESLVQLFLTLIEGDVLNRTRLLRRTIIQYVICNAIFFQLY